MWRKLHSVDHGNGFDRDEKIANALVTIVSCFVPSLLCLLTDSIKYVPFHQFSSQLLVLAAHNERIPLSPFLLFFMFKCIVTSNCALTAKLFCPQDDNDDDNNS